MREYVTKESGWHDIIFLMIREPEEIARAAREFDAITVLVKRHDVAAITSNHADRDVELFHYDYTIFNTGTLEQLENCAKLFVDLLHTDFFEKLEANK